LMPALSRAREQGKRIVCMNNLKQMMLGWNLYAGDNDEKIIFAVTNKSQETNPTFGGSNSRPQKCWAYYVRDGTEEQKLQGLRDGGLFKYVETEKLYKCPTGVPGEVITYAITDAMNGHRGHLAGIKTVMKRTEIRSPSARMVFLDEGEMSPSSWTLFYAEPRWWDNITSRHGNGTNLAMADGHAEYFKWSDSRTIDLSKGLGVDRTQPGNPDLHRVQRAMWGKLGYEPQR